VAQDTRGLGRLAVIELTNRIRTRGDRAAEPSGAVHRQPVALMFRDSTAAPRAG
jgi:hypothetical protein